MPSMVKQNRILLKKAKNHLHPGSIPPQWQWTPVLTGQPGWVRSPWKAFIITLQLAKRQNIHVISGVFCHNTCRERTFLPPPDMPCESWALPLLSIRATLHLVCPSQTRFSSWKHYLRTLCLLSLATTPSPQPSSLHSFPRGACPFFQVPRTRGERFGELGWPVWCTEHCLGSSWAAWTALAGVASGGKLLTRSDPICVWRKGLSQIPQDLSRITAQPWALIYHSSIGKAIHPPASASPCTEPQQWYLPCYCKGAFSGSINLAFMQSSVDRSLNTSSKYHYCYCTSDGYRTDIFQACTINNLLR